MKKQLHPELTIPFCYFFKKNTDTAPLHQETPLLAFVAVADTHLREEGYRIRRFTRLFQSCKSMVQTDCLVICGDITDQGIRKNWEVVESLIPKTPMCILPCMGNHDTWEEESEGGFDKAVTHFTDFCTAVSGFEPNAVYYKRLVKGFPFIVLGRDNPQEPFFSDKQIAFLERELSLCDRKKPVFVVSHYALNQTHGLPETFGDEEYEDYTGGFEGCSDKINAVLQKYDNVILFSGHSHMGLNPTCTFEKVGNIHSLNLPCFMFGNHHGLYHCGLGYVVEVYEHSILFRPRSFLRGRWMHRYTIEIPY